jgi:excisionase family DNA binding protein
VKEVSPMKLWTIDEIASLTGFSLSKVKTAIKNKHLHTQKIGGSRRVRHSQLVEWLGFDPLDEQAVGLEISKTIKTKDKIVTIKTKIEKPLQPTLFDK